MNTHRDACLVGEHSRKPIGRCVVNACEVREVKIGRFDITWQERIDIVFARPDTTRFEPFARELEVIA
ncbi:hypothetical protein COB72_08210 [bacterium]|nr:MAG: hypothetical protein COB72_08210 [bacterium]